MEYANKKSMDSAGTHLQRRRRVEEPRDRWGRKSGAGAMVLSENWCIGMPVFEEYL
jgi:hypothetical protein